MNIEKISAVTLKVASMTSWLHQKQGAGIAGVLPHFHHQSRRDVRIQMLGRPVVKNSLHLRLLITA